MSEDLRNTFAAKGSAPMRAWMADRTVDVECAYVLPVLESLPSNFILCDAGCGPGGITISIAKRFPDALVLAFDIDPPSIEDAKSLAEAAGVTNARFTVGNMLDFDTVATIPGFEALKGGCDVVLDHVTVMHTSDPLKALVNMREAAKTGGWVASTAQDAELNMFYPNSDGLRYWDKLFVDMIRARGCDTRCGRKMVHYALKAGFSRPKIQANGSAITFDTAQKRRLWYECMIHGRTPQSTEMISKSVGYPIDRELLDRGWQEWYEQMDSWLSMTTVNILCEK